MSDRGANVVMVPAEEWEALKATVAEIVKALAHEPEDSLEAQHARFVERVHGEGKKS